MGQTQPAARRYLVRGRVQRVGFRFFVTSSARRMGLTGWTRNLPDGRVEVVARGASVSLDEMKRLLEQGPPAGRVEAVEESAVDVAGIDERLDTFEVRY